MTLTHDPPARTRSSPPPARQLLRLGRLTVLAVCTAAVALVAGLVLGVIGGSLGPVAMVGLPLVACVGLLVLVRPALAPCLVAAATPVGLVQLPLGLDLMQAVAVGVVVVVALRRLAGGSGPLGWDRLLWLGAVVTALALAATPRAPDLALAIRQDAAVVLGLLLVAAVVGACRHLHDVRRVLWTLVVVGAGVCASALSGASAVQARDGGQNVSNRLRGTFTEPNQFGCFSAMVLVLALALFLGARTGRQRAAAGTCAGFALLALGLSLSRGAWIGTALAVAVLLLLVPRARTWLLVLSVPVALLGLTVSLLTPDRPEVQVLRARVATFGDVQGNPYDGRPAIWREARREIEERPWLGQGPGQFPVVSTRSASEAATVSADHAHNVLLTVAAEIGLVAAGLLVAFTMALWARVRQTLRRLRDPRDQALVAGMAGALAVVVGQGLVDFLFRNAVIWSLLCVLVGLTLVASRASGADER